MNIREKNQKLGEILRGMDQVIVAFSAGIDSTFVLARAVEELGERVLAVTAASETFPEREMQEAVALAKLLGVKHEIIQIAEMENPHFVANNPDRCYHCKAGLYGSLTRLAKERNIPWILDGANMDDLGDYRPGRKAAKEYEVRSVLQEAEIYKKELRELAREMGLPNWDKPSFACLSSRIPYGDPITLEKVRQLDRGEQALREMGFRTLRLRHHDTIARIEVPPGEFAKVLALSERITAVLKAEGFTYVTLDLQGYRSGSMNETLKTAK
ncbi:ATP-dependent sacrificial sulfur transferase LarE [Thermoactinomyces sp. CICC 10522]|uniref:ATP-dependent sacrificial sulfur transferase LarE n=1 Tax=Thermoactinomyces sp. CICC 10522 TaxID=2767427 RepID=UPI0018DB450C|nr:ATP-dependent sacrificial sulfur transferase LarE [Thermoactinomyces sp. CICC 10522]MBH8603716.1 ATP-dependent sacrificial sulfur transferase LarE [Thermoactinomyces sp. CICC 10522]